MPAKIHVVAGVLRDSQGRVLITQRQAGTHMAGRWEFPGGKLHAGEDRRDGLARELHEELGISVTQCSPLIRLHHSYPEKTVLLDFWSIQSYEGVPQGVEGQNLSWLTVDELPQSDLLEADRPVVDALSLPDRYAITPAPPASAIAGLAQELSVEGRNFLQHIRTVLQNGAGLVQLRAPNLDAAQLQALAAAAQAEKLCQSLLINGDPRVTVPIAIESGAAGIHLPSRYLREAVAHSVSGEMLVGASCHDADELRLAAQAGANFAVLGPVQATTSHPEAIPMGWDKFASLVDQASLPVYALGGVGPESIDKARSLGAQGVAGISAFFR